MPRGPKLQKAINAPPGARQRIQHETLDPTSDLTENARVEYDRLLTIMDNRGTLDRVDLAVVAECARIKDLLDRVCKAAETGVPERDIVKTIGLLMSQRRGLLRELGLTIKPSTTLVRSDAKSPNSGENVAKLIKLNTGT